MYSNINTTTQNTAKTPYKYTTQNVTQTGKHLTLIKSCENAELEYVKKNIVVKDIDIHYRDPRTKSSLLHSM